VFGYTPNYAPPEQVEWRGTDPRSDLFALGATLFHLVTGVSPVTAQARAAAIKGGHPDPLLPALMLKDDVPRPLSDAIGRAMELDAARRFPSARAMRDALVIEPAVVSGMQKTPEISGARRVDAALPSQAQVAHPSTSSCRCDSRTPPRSDWRIGRRSADLRASSRDPNPFSLSIRSIRARGNGCPPGFESRCQRRTSTSMRRSI